MMVNKLLQLLRDNMRNSAEAPATIRAESTDTEVHLYVYDVIDKWWGANADMLVAGLAAAGDRTVHLHINSPGGDVFEARAMTAAIVAHQGDVIAHIDGVAASAATYLALAASRVQMLDGALFMIHNSWTLAYGDKSDLRSTADLLEKVDGQLVADYAKRTGASDTDVRAWMDAETWFTPAEALDAKFIDSIEPNTKREADASAQALASRWNLSAYANAPKLERPAPVDSAEKDTAAIARQMQANRARLASLHIG